MVQTTEYDFLMAKHDQVQLLTDRVLGTPAIGVVSTKMSQGLMVVNTFSHHLTKQENYADAVKWMTAFEDFAHVIIGGDITA